MKQIIWKAFFIGITLAGIVSCTNKTNHETKKQTTAMKAVQFRIARPTNNLNEVVKFYQKALGLEILGRFDDHAGYDGVMLGMPDKTYHLEFTQHTGADPMPAPTKENLLVFYFDNPLEYQEANERIQAMGIGPVEPENPYWNGKSETYEDPDQWRVILFNGMYTP